MGRASRVPLHSQPVYEDDSDKSGDELSTNRNCTDAKSTFKSSVAEGGNTAGRMQLNSQTICSDPDSRNFKPGNQIDDMNSMPFLSEDVSRCKPVARTDDTDSKVMAVCGVHNGGISCLQG
jgi:hypothetical protein